jgi:hypothetical protein
LPFVAGVALGKQMIIWPLGLGLLAIQDDYPMIFVSLNGYRSPISCIWPTASRVCASACGIWMKRRPDFSRGLLCIR